ncbi:MAG: hypothetical protein HOH74_23200 [Gemmatimonadetes bacterium]|nr:hypothetical protein [Gemmatimonadota bacterium]MBT6148360.1 hypothetical protein [Gemmatimonadota bacterium]
MPPLEAWKKVLVDSTFLATTHGQRSCVDCHGGDASADSMGAAHTGMDADPSEYCVDCHISEGANFEDSQHAQLDGYRNLIAQRAGVEKMTAGMEEMFEANCNKCHVTCGQCHISRPRSVGSGFLAGHEIQRRPSMVLNCTACHGSRIGSEYRGENVGIPPDSHYLQGMQCVACHGADEMHGHGSQGDTRYEVEMAPTCEDCHDTSLDAANTYHQSHGDKVQCQVCHSTTYKNCYNCHVGEGLEQPSEMDFKIGRNPLKSDERPYDFVVLRHIPIAPDSYRDYVPGPLVDFASVPTWKYATPHNIQRTTPQTADCTSSCHGNADLFLTAADLERLPAEEVEANQGVIVKDIP